jgi:hypothetical protein
LASRAVARAPGGGAIGLCCRGIGVAAQPLVFLHRDDRETPRPCFSMSTGSARAVSIIRPKAFFASRADMVFIVNPVAVNAAI